jgi:peptide deformylase
MNIVLYPDPRLLAKTRPLAEVTDEVRERVEEMFRLMYETQGVGLAAPQVGWSVRLFVMNPTGDAAKKEDERVLINPQILKKRGRANGEEGCLSYPGIYVEVERSKSIVVRATNLDGNTEEVYLNEFPARVVQHEFDHLENILLAHRMSAADRIRFRDALEELKSAYSKAS